MLTGDSLTPGDGVHAAALEAALAETPVIGIVRLSSAADARSAMQAAVSGGIRVVEVTLTTPGALEVLAWGGSALAPAVVGAGSVRTAAEAQAAIDAGAAFLVTPTVDLDVLELAVRRGVPVVCGAYTPTELDQARRGGALLQKLFPASRLGPGHLREVLAPMPDLRIVPTGGVTVDNTAEWFAAGASAVAVASALVSARQAEDGAWREVTSAAARFVAAARWAARPA